MLTVACYYILHLPMVVKKITIQSRQKSAAQWTISAFRYHRVQPRQIQVNRMENTVFFLIKYGIHPIYPIRSKNLK